MHFFGTMTVGLLDRFRLRSNAGEFSSGALPFAGCLVVFWLKQTLLLFLVSFLYLGLNRSDRRGGLLGLGLDPAGFLADSFGFDVGKAVVCCLRGENQVFFSFFGLFFWDKDKSIAEGWPPPMVLVDRGDSFCRLLNDIGELTISISKEACTRSWEDGDWQSDNLTEHCFTLQGDLTEDLSIGIWTATGCCLLLASLFSSIRRGFLLLLVLLSRLHRALLSSVFGFAYKEFWHKYRLSNNAAVTKMH